MTQEGGVPFFFEPDIDALIKPLGAVLRMQAEVPTFHN